MTTLICYDPSPSAQRALQVAHDCLGGHRAAVLLHVWNPPERIHADSFGVGDSRGPSYEELTQFNEARAAEILARGQQLAESLGLTVSVRAECSRSSVWQTILEVADELDCGLIVTGTHGRTAVTTGLLGSVSGALIRNSPRPVLAVPHSPVSSQPARSAVGDHRAGAEACAPDEPPRIGDERLIARP